MMCDTLEKKIEEKGYIVRNRVDDNGAGECVIDFQHPKVTTKGPAGWYLSGVRYRYKDGWLKTTVRSKVDDFKELYLEYCCEAEDGECNQMCRPHVNMKDKIFSVEAGFHVDPLGKFGRLLEELF